MASGFPFGQKPNEAPQFGQSSFGSLQFGAPASTGTTTNPQFSTTFAAKPSGSFQFSTPTSTPAFGAAFNFTSPTQATTTTTPSFGFSTTTPAYSFAGPTPGLFSTPTTTQSTLFQAPTSMGTSTTMGYSLGGAKSPFTSTPSGGMFAMPAITSSVGQSPSLNFSTPSTQQISGTTFGTTQSSMPKMTFGPSTGISFNAIPTTTTSGISFGLTSMASTPKLSFGPSVASTPLNFAAPQTLTTSTGLNLSAPSKPIPSTGLSFAPTSSVGLTFGTPTSQNIGLNFSSAPTPGLPFGPPPPAPAVTTTPSMGLNFGTSTSAPLGFSMQPKPIATSSLGTTFVAPASLPTTTLISSSTTAPLTFGTAPQPTITTTAAPTLSFPTSAPTTALSTFATPATTTPSLSFGTPKVTSTATASTGLSFGLGGVSTTKPTTAISSTTFGLGAQPPPIPPRTVGLGGISSTPPKLAAPTTTQAEIAPKHQPLPNELLQTVEQFKKFIQEQKSFSSEIARSSIKELRKVEADVDLVNNCINEVENEMRKNKAMAEKIKLDTAKGLQNAEMAQRTFDTPAGLQYENTAPFEYFIELSDTFEKEMNELKLRIESVNKHVRNTMNPTKLNSQDLALGMRRLHETFVALAGQLQSVHNQVEIQKEQYLNLRKTMLNDYTNVFETQNESKGLETILSNLAKQQLHSNSSPTPFNLLRSSQVQTVAQNPSTSLPTTMNLGAPITTGFNVGAATTIPLFGSNLTSASSLFNTSASNAFQLQKPPVGNKRGKP
ncbi:hypothetical protein RI129_007852 [Pyrocoelia pectoralis]|uniref:Nucleoporin 58 n=1 Tax=Pyrocoelia pectoralis TaxID=417401 RepID=A0AAN7VAE6_9COLE